MSISEEGKLDNDKKAKIEFRNIGQKMQSNDHDLPLDEIDEANQNDGREPTSAIPSLPSFPNKNSSLRNHNLIKVSSVNDSDVNDLCDLEEETSEQEEAKGGNMHFKNNFKLPSSIHYKKDGTESSEQDERDKDVRGGLSPEAKRYHPGFEVGVVQRKSTKPIKKEDFVLDDGSRENESSLKSTDKSRENVAQSCFEEMKITPKPNYEPFLSDSCSKDSKLYDIGEEAKENCIKMLNYHRPSPPKLNLKLEKALPSFIELDSPIPEELQVGYEIAKYDIIGMIPEPKVAKPQDYKETFCKFQALACFCHNRQAIFRRINDRLEEKVDIALFPIILEKALGTPPDLEEKKRYYISISGKKRNKFYHHKLVDYFRIHKKSILLGYVEVETHTSRFVIGDG
ncbi:unnamed protein product [Moneuplotes crassus]|uniref:Uncharacterized protein n=1 Tax=Euplotes crassus TaxID=5936 RepID=A0AAD1UPE3_EUPCR|nr:unnamed protein product [Moneuplotes crassus]